MATQDQFFTHDISKDNPHFSTLKTIVETAFYGNNVTHLKGLSEVYQLAKKSPSTIVLDMPVTYPEKLHLPDEAKILVHNGGAVTGRTAKARRILGRNLQEDQQILPKIREAIYQASLKPYYASEALVGLDEDFMVRAHLMLPKEEVANLYSWLLNFQAFTEVYYQRYLASKPLDENDIYIFFDPTWKDEAYPDGLAYFDTLHNTAVILGLNYFGEIKKGTLTLAWATAARHDYVACHGGLKIFKKAEQKPYVASFFGLSGSGKSTLTHAKHDGKYAIQVLHDDAFIISTKNGSSIALESSYFDKTNDYPAGHPEQDYFVTVQNCGVTLNHEGKKVLVTEDIRNGNGRTVKSRYATPNRVDKIEEAIDAIFWIMKDDSLPPILKVDNSSLSSTLGCTLMTKRSNAENGVSDLSQLVIEPYANPFRVYPLVEDFKKFQELFDSGVDCYIVNTGNYLGKSIPKEVTLAAIEKIVEGVGNFIPFGELSGCSYLELQEYPLAPFDASYRQLLKDRMQLRLDFLLNFNHKNDQNPIPVDAIYYLQEVIDRL